MDREGVSALWRRRAIRSCLIFSEREEAAVRLLVELQVVQVVFSILPH